MESELNDSYIDLENYDVSHIIKLQALFRGILVRKKMKNLRDVYLGLVDSIETNKQISVSWETTGPSHPRFIKHKRQGKVDKSKELEAERLQSEDCKEDHRTVETNITDMESHCGRRMVSVEIQTNGETGGYNLESLNTETPTSHTDQCENELYTERSRFDCENKDYVRQTESVQLMQDARTDQPVKLLPEKVDSNTVVKTVESVDFVDLVSGHQEVDKSDTSSLTEMTSIWESQCDSKLKQEEVKNINSSSILEVRKNIAMELLWVQQAINSRKNYLRLKSQMD